MSSGNLSGGTPFDPCRQWLGISALELDDPKKLLGLESVDDPIGILQAAERRLARLHAVEAGPYEVARRALVARVEEARERLLMAAASSGMAATPASPGGLTMPPSPIAAPDQSPTSEQPFPPATAGYPPHPGPGVIPDAPAPMQQPTPVHSHGGMRSARPVYGRPSSNEPLMLLAGALFTAVVALGIFAMQQQPRSVASRPTTSKQDAKKPSTSARSLKPAGPLKPAGHPLASRNRTFAFPTEEEPRQQPTPEDRNAIDPDRGEPALRDEPTTAPPSEPDEPRPDEPRMDEAEPEPAAPTPKPPPEPKMKKPEPPPADEPDPLARIDDAVKQCLEAVWQRDYDAAERAMKAVEGIAPDDREANRIAGWLMLTAYSKGFFDYQDRAVDAMKPGDEYDVKTKRIAVVEVTHDSLTVKVAGQLKTWRRDDIPGAVVRTVVEAWFDDNPSNQLYLGAYHFTKPEPDLQQAEACWSKAMIGGADASLLIPLLTDPVVVDAVKP